jgi:transcriptional regulator with XRE-family HTH domain
MKHTDAEAVTRIVMQILKERRESKGLSYRKLAKKSGISNRYLSMIENGEYVRDYRVTGAEWRGSQ